MRGSSLDVWFWRLTLVLTLQSLQIPLLWLMRGPSLDVRIWRRLKSIPALKGLNSQSHRAYHCRVHTHLGCVYVTLMCVFNHLTAKLFNLNFHPLEVVSRWRDPQLQVSENYSDLTKWGSTLFKSCWLMSHFIFIIFNVVFNVLIKNKKPNICGTSG